MKVVINRCFGGFDLSREAIEACISLGMSVGDGSGDDDFSFDKEFNSYYCNKKYENSFRCDPRVIQVVEKLGEKANTPLAWLKIVQIPFDKVEGWKIHNYDGIEQIEEIHRIWR